MEELGKPSEATRSSEIPFHATTPATSADLKKTWAAAEKAMTAAVRNNDWVRAQAPLSCNATPGPVGKDVVREYTAQQFG